MTSKTAVLGIPPKDAERRRALRQSIQAATLEIPPSDAAKLGGFLKAFVTAADAAERRMQRDQTEIDRLKAETRAMLAEIKALR